MRDELKACYAHLRRRPVVGAVASRLVWSVKGALGRPLSLPAAGAPPAPPPAPPPDRDGDMALVAALAAARALGADERLARLGRTPPRTASPDGGGRRSALAASVVVCTLDRAPWLARALAALAYQRHASFEVIVVAGPSRDDTDEVLAIHAGAVQVVRCAQANLAIARNVGLAAAQGEVVAFLDDDATPEPDWLEHLCAPYADAGVGGVGGYLRGPDGVGWQCRATTADRLGRPTQHARLRDALPDPPGPGVERFLSLTGANASFRRDALLQIGGFDEAFAYFLDETDVCLRLAEAGWRLTVAAQAEAHHAFAPNAERTADRTPRRLAPTVRSTAYFALRHAAPRHGLALACDHLGRHARGLQADTHWRRRHGLLTEAAACCQLAEIEAGVAQGVRMALDAPRRLQAAPAARARSRPADPRLRDDGRLKLCLLSQDWPEPGRSRPAGGIAVWTRALAEAMAGLGHEITVVTRSEPGLDASGAEEPTPGGSASAAFQALDGGRAGLWLHRTPLRPAHGQLVRPPLLRGLPASVAAPAQAAAAEVLRILPRRRFDLVMGPLWDLEPAGLVGRTPCPVAVSLHTSCAQAQAFQPQWRGEHLRRHVEPVIAGERRLLAACPHVLANSAAAARDVGAALGLDDLASRAVHIPHGLPDLAAGVRPAERPATGVEILFVGRLERRKGVEALLQAAATVLRTAPDARLRLVGEDCSATDEPSWRERLQREGAGAAWTRRVVFEGALPRPALLARYAAADIVVVPSLYESFGLTALEAMIFAKPCVAAGVGGLAELVAHGETGLLAPPGEADALAGALLALSGDAALRARLGQAGRRRYERRYTAQAMAGAMEAWVGSLAPDRARMAAE